MRAPVLVALFAIAGAVALGVEAFDASSSGARAVEATLTGDASSYLALSANEASPFAEGIVEDGASGLVSVWLGDALAPGSRLLAHDALRVTNQAGGAAFVQVAAEGAALACVAAEAGSMTRACYASRSPPEAIRLDAGESLLVGVGLDAWGLDAGDEAEGSVRVVSCRTSACR